MEYRSAPARLGPRRWASAWAQTGAAPEEVLSPRIVGRISATLFLLCGGLVALLAPLVPFHQGASRLGILTVGLVAAACGPVIWFLPWNRWGRASTLSLVFPAMALVGLHNYFTGYDGFLYGLFFMVIFVWLGLGHPQGRSLACAPLFTAAYLLPLLWGGHHPALAAGSLAYALPCCILTGETVSWVSSRLRRSEAARAENEETFRRLFESNPQPMWVCDADDLRFLEVNDAALHHYGFSRSRFLTIGQADLETEGARTGAADHPERETTQHRLADGRVVVVELSSHTITFHDQVALLMSALDVTERARLEDQLRHQAFHDPLTNLANRALFADRLTHALTRAGSGAPDVALLLFDLDGFKTVNDSLGHSAGDALLEKVAERLRASLSPSDTAARLGGDEFAVLIEAPGGAGPALSLASRLMRALEAPFTVENRQVVVQASFGIAPALSGKDSANELLRNADVAMYRAKAEGLGGVAIFEPHMHAAALARLEVDAELRTAQAKGELELFYQPLVSLPEGELVGVEALLRWHHPVRGLVGPTEFIPIAEQTGLVVELGQWVLVTACRQLADWQSRQGPGSVAVNLSARQLLSPGFVEEVAAALAASGADPAGLTLELTESLLMEDTQTAGAVLGALRQLGVRIALDDFGTGYSSLSYLRQFPLDDLKIDKSFVDQLDATGDSSVVSGILGLGSALGLSVVAEGVETAAQADVLSALGCRLAQGFLFGRPLPVAELERHWFLTGPLSEDPIALRRR